MTDQRKPQRVRPHVANAFMQDTQRITDGRQGVREKILGERADVVLVSREDDDPSIADKVVNPGTVEPRVHGKPAVQKYDNGCPPVRLGHVGLE